MQARPSFSNMSAAAVLALVLGTGSVASATVPCGDFGECRALVEINSTDGDIGFHFLMDGDDLLSAEIRDPNGARIFDEKAKGPLAEQKLTETFAESAEPLCWDDPEADPDEQIVTLEEFLARWAAGTYVFSGRSESGELSTGETQLTYELPAAPSNVTFDGSKISWTAGNDLGKCASRARLNALVASGLLPVHPQDVPVAAWEVVLSPDVDDGDPLAKLVYTIRVPGNIAPKSVTVPSDYLDSLPDDTPVKIEVGAIGPARPPPGDPPGHPDHDDNATFTEVDGFCVNERAGCD